MKCPVCDEGLLLAERQGIEMDYCPKCRGVWLDRGELDILIERSKALDYGSPQERGRYDQHEERDYRGDSRDERHHRQGHHGDKHHDEHHGHRRRKRNSFLENLFDFGD